MRRWRCRRESRELTANTALARPGPDSPAARLGPYQLAILLVLLGSFANSTNGLLLRSIEEASPWQIIAIRMGSLTVALVVVYVLQQRRSKVSSLRRIGKWGLLGAVMIAIANAGFVWSMSHTTVANTMFILSAVPFITALLGWIFLRERVSGRLWAAMFVAVAGISIMVADGLGGGSLFGSAMALLAAFTFAGFVIVLRHGRSENMLPIVILGSIIGFGFASLMADFDFAVPAWDFAIACFWGAFLSSMVHVFFVFGSRYVQGAELTLMVLLEFILAPLWVWLVFAEQASLPTLIGGLLVISAVASRGILALRKGRFLAAKP